MRRLGGYGTGLGSTAFGTTKPPRSAGSISSTKAIDELRQLAPDHVAEDVDYLLGRAGGGLGGAVDLLQGVVEVDVVEGDDRLAEGGGEAGVEGRVPLAVFVAE